jgi:hypothetical protein
MDWLNLTLFDVGPRVGIRRRGPTNVSHKLSPERAHTPELSYGSRLRNRVWGLGSTKYSLGSHVTHHLCAILVEFGCCMMYGVW